MRNRLLLIVAVVLIGGGSLFLLPLQANAVSPDNAEQVTTVFRQVGIFVFAIAAVVLIRLPD